MSYRPPDKLKTTVVGSYPYFSEALKAFQLRKKGQRGPEYESLVKEATRRAVEDYINVGLDIIADGEQRREDMAVFFAEELGGFEISDLVRIFDNVYFRKPVIADRITWIHEIVFGDWKYASGISRGRPVKVTLTGPYTMYSWSFDKFYGDPRKAILDLAEALRKEIEALVGAGAAYIQVDEPAFSTRAEKSDLEIAEEAFEIMFEGLDNVKRITHICYGKLERLFPAILDFPIDQLDLETKNSNYKVLDLLREYSFDKELALGVVDVHSSRIEAVDEVIEGILRGLEVVRPDKLYVKPDCGLKRLSREVALAKLENMVKAAKKVREELA
ncbi:MAG: methionine synthase [Nitrososphaeria archaeon]|nr:methionine synthase [Nitrososphaeria archaeon]